MATPKYVAGRFLPGYNVFNPSLNESGVEFFNGLIIKRLPDGADWCGDEVLMDCIWNDDKGRYEKGDLLDLGEIINAAADELMDNGRDDIWEA